MAKLFNSLIILVLIISTIGLIKSVLETELYNTIIYGSIEILVLTTLMVVLESKKYK
jgi:hypothetical protein